MQNDFVTDTKIERIGANGYHILAPFASLGDQPVKRMEKSIEAKYLNRGHSHSKYGAMSKRFAETRSFPIFLKTPRKSLISLKIKQIANKISFRKFTDV